MKLRAYSVLTLARVIVAFLALAGAAILLIHGRGA